MIKLHILCSLYFQLVDMTVSKQKFEISKLFIIRHITLCSTRSTTFFTNHTETLYDCHCRTCSVTETGTSIRVWIPECSCDYRKIMLTSFGYCNATNVFIPETKFRLGKVKF